MEELIKKVISVSGTAAINAKADGKLIGVNIFEKAGEKDVKYGVFFTKKDGTESKASQQFHAQHISIGSEVGIAYKETPNTYDFKTKDGETKTFNGVNRNIVFFSEPDTIEQFATKKPLSLEEEKTIDDFGEDDGIILTDGIPF